MPTIASLRRNQRLRHLAIACGFAPWSLFAISLVVAFLLYGPLAQDPRGYIARTLDGGRPDVISHQLGLDESWYRHGLQWPIDAVRGDLGTSAFTGRDIRHLIAHSALMNLELLLLSVALGTLVALALVALHRRSERQPARQAIIILSAALGSVPGFVALLLLILLPGDYFNYAPPADHALLTDDVWNNLRLVGPVAIVIGTIGGAATWTAVAAGPLHLRHIAGLMLSHVPLAIGGIIIAELLFPIDGAGRLLFVSAQQRDLPAVQSAVILILFLATLAYALRRALVGTSAPDAPPAQRTDWRRPLVVAAMAGIALFVAIGVLAPFIEPYDPNKISFTLRNQSPSWQHILGTTKFGQDEVSRVVEGMRTSVKFTAAVLAFGFLPGSALGLAIGRGRIRLRRAVEAVADAVVSMPALVLILVLVAARGPGLDVVAIPVALVAFATGLRAAARLALPERTPTAPKSWIVRCGALSPALFEAAILAVLAEATVGFLGLGASLTGISLGAEIMSAGLLETHHALLYGPAAALYVALLSCTLAAAVRSQRLSAGESGLAPEAHGVTKS